MNNSDDVEKKTYWKPACAAICPRVLDQSYFLKIEMTDYYENIPKYTQ